MSSIASRSPGERLTLDWLARVGAADVPALARHLRRGERTVTDRLRALRAAGLVEELALPVGRQALWRATSAGLRAVGLGALGRCRVSASSAAHLRGCAELAAVLEHRHPDHGLFTERELRRIERGRPAGEPPLCSPALELRAGYVTHTHRPDLVLWPRDGGLPVAVELELTVKAPARLRELCRAWARCRTVAGVVYYAAGPAERAVNRAVAAVRAYEAIVVVPLAAVLDAAGDSAMSIDHAVGAPARPGEQRRAVAAHGNHLQRGVRSIAAINPTEGEAACRGRTSTA